MCFFFAPPLVSNIFFLGTVGLTGLSLKSISSLFSEEEGKLHAVIIKKKIQKFEHLHPYFSRLPEHIFLSDDKAVPSHPFSHRKKVSCLKVSGTTTGIVSP